MTQYIVGAIDENATDGFLLADIIEGLRDNFISQNSGNAAPGYATKGTIWLDVSTTPHVLKIYDGSDSWFSIMQMDPANNTFSLLHSGTPLGALAVLSNIQASHIANDSINADKIDATDVNNIRAILNLGSLALSSVITTSDIADNAVTPDKISNIGQIAGQYANATVTVNDKGLVTAIEAGVLSPVQSWADFTASRTLNTNYTNTTGHPIEVSISGIGTTFSTAKISLIIDGIIVQSDGISGNTDGSLFGSVSAVVPNGSVYSVTSTAGVTIETWSEKR